MEDTTLSKAEFLRWMNPLIVALKQLGGSATPAKVRKQIIKNEQLSKAEISKTRGKNGTNKFANELAFARAYLVYGDYIKNETRGVWELTDAGKCVEMTDQLASKLFREYQAQNRLKKNSEETNKDEIEISILEDFPEKSENTLKKYGEEDFLREVFMEKENYDMLRNLLKLQKNIILQGAPGVGKTFVAKRLAYSMLGTQDTERVEVVQFHQSYAYEDFILGYRPTKEGGFELKEGPFYTFCKKAEADLKHPYFFLIDEINRGNLSKIFGELFLLLERDKRGKENQIRLLYSDELFSIPENVFVIGTMNTADRGLAMLDYALRRRFMFYEIAPAFETEGFERYLKEKNEEKLTNVIREVKQLNKAIAEDECLGRGFCIGHSYFCKEETAEDCWLRVVVEYQIIPLLEEYWFDEPAKVKKWSEILRSAIL